MKDKNTNFAMGFSGDHLFCHSSSADICRYIDIYLCFNYQVESTVIQFSCWYLSDDVRESNRGSFSSKYEEILRSPHHFDLHLGDLVGTTEIHPTIPVLLASSLLPCVFSCGQHKHDHVQCFIPESEHSCNSSEQVFQGEEELCLDVETW
jgi:hypothetical protein